MQEPTIKKIAVPGVQRGCHVIIDIEALGLQADSVVMSIGAAAIVHSCNPLLDETTRDIYEYFIPETFYTVLGVQPQLDLGRKIDQSTLKWWGNVHTGAEMVLVESLVCTDLSGLDRFREWLNTLEDIYGPVCVWGNGASFDLAAVRSLFGEAPWFYRNEGCLRVAMRMRPTGFRSAENTMLHHAREDALSEAKTLCALQYALGPDVKLINVTPSERPKNVPS